MSAHQLAAHEISVLVAAGIEAVAEALASAVAAEGDGTGSDAAAHNDASDGDVDGGRRKRRRTAGAASGVRVQGTFLSVRGLVFRQVVLDSPRHTWSCSTDTGNKVSAGHRSRLWPAFTACNGRCNSCRRSEVVRNVQGETAVGSCLRCRSST